MECTLLLRHDIDSYLGTQAHKNHVPIYQDTNWQKLENPHAPEKCDCICTWRTIWQKHSIPELDWIAELKENAVDWRCTSLFQQQSSGHVKPAWLSPWYIFLTFPPPKKRRNTSSGTQMKGVGNSVHPPDTSSWLVRKKNEIHHSQKISPPDGCWSVLLSFFPPTLASTEVTAGFTSGKKRSGAKRDRTSGGG